MPSGSFSLGGTWIWLIFARLMAESAPVTSLEAAGVGGAIAGAGGISTEAVLSELFACAAAACAARRAAAMKLDDDTGSLGAAGISLIALSEAAMRSEGEATRPPGRVPGSSGWSGGNSGAIAARAGAV